jgi:low temperature requirement protein LtrA
VSLTLHTRMAARATDEEHRVSSQLELLFDLTFVIAVAALTERFAEAVGAGRASEQIVPFLQVFFAIWWAWANFTWFASAFDTDDVPFRLLTAVQMAGVLVLAAGVPAALDHGDYGAVTLGYLIMRVGLLAQWLPGSRSWRSRGCRANGLPIADCSPRRRCARSSRRSSCAS